MSDYLTRGFRAQLTLTMEATLRKAVCDIMRIFENSLHDHQLELVQKGEEVAHLKVKLQTAELKLKEWECKITQGLGKSKSQLSETQRAPGVGMNPCGQNTDVPEIDFEVPDDWCAPLGDETTKQDDSVCPSVRLRPLLIHLHRIPIIKQEVTSQDIDSHQQTKNVRRSTRGSTLNERREHTQDKILPKRGRGRPKKTVRDDIKKFILDIRQENSHQTGSIGLRLRETRVVKKEQDNAVKSRREDSKAPTTKSTEETVENNGKKYSCKFCEKIFDTEFGQYIHTQSHRRCRGCKKVFPFPSTLAYHKPHCEKFKKLLAKNTPCTKPVSFGEEKLTSPSKEQVILMKESSPSSGHHSETSIQKVGPIKKHSCIYCNKRFFKRNKLRDHIRVHTGEKPFRCTVCQKKFRIKASLKKHIMRMHQDQMNTSDINRDLAWTKPIEGTEGDREHLILPCKDKHPTVSHNSVQRGHSPDKSSEWQTMGVRNSDGFICSICKKLLKTRYMLIEHYRIHTGEKPLKCRECPATFRTGQQRYLHRKRYHSGLGMQCEKCKKLLPSKARYYKHVSKCLTEKPITCKVCGKGFYLKGRLLNHMERCHS